MTKLRYSSDCAAGSQDREIASSPSDYAWNVNFDNGNSNWNNQNNEGFVRAVRPGECQHSVSLASLHAAWREARRGKKPSANQLTFDAHWLDGLLDLQGRLSSGTWSPRPPTCFIAKEPKAREIHAPDFSDRVVHHWLVPQLECIYEPIFIHDVYSNRVGKGTHAAVERLKAFVHQVDSGQSGGWYLQLDVRNFFNSIHRPTLYRLLKARMEKHELAMPVQRTTHALLRRSATAGGPRYACTPAERASVPPHKRLENAEPGCGIAIGNLSSQFFANVYLNELDQFVKHELRVPRYLRYVDDFVLVHRNREQLLEWQREIERFLEERLVRRRVIQHARDRLDRWQQRHVRSRYLIATPGQLRELRSVCASYRGHFSHANNWRLRRRFVARYPWLRDALRSRRFDHRLEDRSILIPRITR